MSRFEAALVSSLFDELVVRAVSFIRNYNAPA